MSNHDVTIIRDLTKRYRELVDDPANDEKRDLWRAHNALQETRIPVFARAFAWKEMADNRKETEDPFWHGVELFLRKELFRARFEDDWIFEPWISVPAARQMHPGGYWGTEVTWLRSEHPHGGKAMDCPIKEPEDVAKLLAPRHEIDEAETQVRLERLQDAIGDLIQVAVDRSPLSRVWHGDISTDLGHLRGLDNLMYDMMDRPDWLHQLLGFMRDAILATHQQAEENGDWHLRNHENQSLPYVEELADPVANGAPVKRRELWHFCASQETTLIGPAQFDEFMLQYQLPIMAEFGLVAYGCCEDLTRKIDVLRQVPNLRRIAVSPMADAPACAEQIGRDYVISYRPSPADMVAYRFDEERIRRIYTQDLEAFKAHNCCVDICLKDVETVEGDTDRVRRWNKLTRQVVDEIYS